MAYRGKSLKAVRLSQHVELRSIANATRIGIAYLQDLEEERFDRFPGKFYFNSFSKAYARSLGLDPNVVAVDLGIAYEQWSGANGNGGSPRAMTAQHEEEEGIWGRITGFIRRAQEV